MKPICKIVENRSELDEAHSIRNSVFVLEQNVPESLEWDEYDGSNEAAIHILCKFDDKVVGTGRIIFLNNKAKLERVAVLKSYRRQGIGTKIVRFMIQEITRQGEITIFANVQMIARKFYATLGFKEVGETFTEAGIEHIKMVFYENE